MLAYCFSDLSKSIYMAFSPTLYIKLIQFTM